MILFYRSRILWQFRVEVVIIIPTTVGQESAILDGTCQEEVFSLEWQELGLTEDAGRYEKKRQTGTQMTEPWADCPVIVSIVLLTFLFPFTSYHTS